LAPKEPGRPQIAIAHFTILEDETGRAKRQYGELMMSTRDTIVTYREIAKIIGNHESTSHAESEKSADNPAEAARMLAGLAGALTSIENADKNPGVLIAPDHKVASLLLTFLAKRANEKGQLEELPIGAKEAKFDSHDWLGWAGSFFSWWKKIEPHAFLTAAPLPEALDDTIRVAIIGDWGTGLYGAPVCTQSITNDAMGYGLAVHLGDVYYSGDASEVKERFLELWPRKVAISRALNSNHEMYTGGHAYFDLTLKEFGQAASYFAFQNSHWVLVGLDSGYVDRDLAGGQVEWLRNIINNAGDRKVILMSHHQPVSPLEQQSPNLVEKIGEFLNGRRIFAWYWGHEHRCIVYDKHPAWDMYGRAVGHGGFPYFRDNVSGLSRALPNWYRLEAKNLIPGGLLLDGPNPYVKGHANQYGPNGYMTLEFDGPHLNELVHDPSGAVIYDRSLI
jgi:Calcineurin-like phosphoesterase